MAHTDSVMFDWWGKLEETLTVKMKERNCGLQKDEKTEDSYNAEKIKQQQQ